VFDHVGPFHELINLQELFAGHRAVAEGVCSAGFGEKEGAAVVVEPGKAGLEACCAGVAGR
jgi:hypothetical protein